MTVNTTTDENTFGGTDPTLSLREAMELANGTLAVGALSPQEAAQVSGTPNTAGVTDTIQFSVTGTILLEGAAGGDLPAITSTTHPIIIQGPGASLLSVDGNAQQFRPFAIAAGGFGVNVTLCPG
jgi:hypothetical protein